jgi:hypothetical protein
MGCGSANCHRQLYAGPPVLINNGCCPPGIETRTARIGCCNVPLLPLSTCGGISGLIQSGGINVGGGFY